jgi:hypothetical protein
MSCFILEGRRIAALAAELVKLHSDKLPLSGDGEPHDRESLADAMLALNLDAFRQRYGTKTMLEDVAEYVDPDARNWTPLDKLGKIQFFKSLQCFLYQCSEGNVPDRPLFKALQAVEDFLAPTVNQESPGYNAAIWG